MSEIGWSLYFLGTVLVNAFSAGAYSMGGRSNEQLKAYNIPFSNRTWKRLIAHSIRAILIISCSVILGRYHWQYLIAVGTLYVPLGYGGNGVLTKVLRRVLWSILFSICAFIIAYYTHKWLLYGVQTAVSMVCSVAFGVWNPFDNAAEEEGVIYLISILMTPFIL